MLVSSQSHPALTWDNGGAPADNDLARTPMCEGCHGKAGTHPCGCWADADREPVCGHCNQDYKGLPVAWPCPTIAALGGEQS